MLSSPSETTVCCTEARFIWKSAKITSNGRRPFAVLPLTVMEACPKSVSVGGKTNRHQEWSRRAMSTTGPRHWDRSPSNARAHKDFGTRSRIQHH